jgi:hypothetical protein
MCMTSRDWPGPHEMSGCPASTRRADAPLNPLTMLPQWRTLRRCAEMQPSFHDLF